MSPWLGLDKLFVLLLRLFLSWCTRATALPHNIEELGIAADKPVFYVLKDRSVADLLVADKEAQKLGLPSALAGIDLGETHLKQAHCSIYRRNVWPQRLRRTSKPKRLPQLITLLADNPDLDIQLLPVSVLWGRRPDKENSIWRIIFADNWSPAGLIKKFFIVLTQGKQLYVQFSPVMSLRQLVDETEDQARVLRKTARILRVHFRLQREAVIGPDLSHRRMLVSSLIQSTPVRAAIEQQAQKDNITLAKAEARAKHYAFEIAADYSHTVIRFLDVILNWVWHRLFNGVRIYNLDRVRQVAKEHEIVYVPCHRSHLDYLLMSFVLYRNGLAPPHIAAGVNLNLPIVGTILRRGGAFFMRRSFKNNPLYATVFNEYMHTMLSRGYSLEYFIEGGRSRSGRMLQPRTGMLSMTLKSFLRGSRLPVAFVPVYVGYERVVEAASYIGEMHGQKKKKETVGGLLGSLKILRSNWGQVHVNIGDPICLTDFLNEQQPDWQDSDPSSWMRSVVARLGHEVANQINAAAVVNPIGLLSLALLATDKHTIDEQLLICQLGLYIKLLEQAPYSQSAVLSETDPRAIIDYALENSFAFRIDHPHGPLISTDETSALQMTYIRNNILHLFALPGLVSSLFRNARVLTSEHLHELVQLLYPFLRSEYSLHWEPGEELDAAVNTLLDAMLDQGLLLRHTDTPDGVDTLEGAAAHTLEADQLYHLGKTVLQMQERLFLTIRILVQQGCGEITAAELRNQAQLGAQRLSLVHEFNSPDFFDKTIFKSLVSQLKKHGLVTSGDDSTLSFDARLLELDEESSYLLGAETRLTLRRVARQSGV